MPNLAEYKLVIHIAQQTTGLTLFAYCAAKLPTTPLAFRINIFLSIAPFPSFSIPRYKSSAASVIYNGKLTNKTCSKDASLICYIFIASARPV
jgi:hypothetical protein